MQKFEVNFFDYDTTLSFEYKITQTINPMPIKTIGEISLLPAEGDSSIPVPSEGHGADHNSGNPTVSTCPAEDQPDDDNRKRVIPRTTAQKAATASQAILDEVDYESTEIVLHSSGKDLEIDLDNSIRIRSDITKDFTDLTVYRNGSKKVVKRSDGNYVLRDGIDETTDEIIDPIQAGIESAEKLITNVLPVGDPQILMDVDLWYRTRIGQLEVGRENQFWFQSEDDEVIRDDRRYAVKTTRKVKRRWWEFLLGRGLTSRENIYSLDYDDYKALIEQLESRLTPLGIAVEVKEYRNDHLDKIEPQSSLSIPDTVLNAVNIFVAARPDKFPSNPTVFEVTPTDMSVRELMRRLFDPRDSYDRRDIKTRDIYTDAKSNAVDGSENPPTNVGEDEFQVITEAEYNEKYRNLYNQLAYFAFPVKFGKQDVYIKVCEDGEEVTKKVKVDIGTKIVTVLFHDTTKLSAFRKQEVPELPAELAETITENVEIDTIVECKIPNLPEDEVLRKMGFDIYGDVEKSGADILFPSDSNEIVRLNPLVRNKFEFLIKILKNEFGKDRVKLVETTKSVEKFRNTVSEDSTFLSWHNHGFAARILVFNSSDEVIKDDSDEFKKLLSIAKLFIKGNASGLFGESVKVIWGAQLNVNPDPFEWEILPSGYSHKETPKYREEILNLRNPLTGEDLTPKNIEEFIFFINTKFDAYGTEIPEIESDNIISTPVGSLSGPITYITDSGERDTLSVGEYVELEKQLDDALNGMWEIKDGKWEHADKYIKWKNDNPISYEQMKIYYSLIGDYVTVRSLLAIEYIEKLASVDQGLDSETYLSQVLKSSDGLTNFYNGIPDGVDGSPDISSQDLENAIKATDVSSPASFFMVDDKKIKTPLFEIKLTKRSSTVYESKLVNGSAKIIANSGSFEGIEIGDVVSGAGIDGASVTVEKIYDLDLIKLSAPVTLTGLSDLSFSPASTGVNKNLHGQETINPINVTKYLTGEHDSTDAEFLSDEDRSAMLDKVKVQVIEHLESIKKSYVDTGAKFLFDKFENGPNAENEIFLENDFGVINVQEIIDIDILANMYDGQDIAVPELIYDPDTEQKNEELLNIFEETVSIARGARISTLGREKPEIEPLEDDRDLKRELLNRYGKQDSKFDVSDF